MNTAMTVTGYQQCQKVNHDITVLLAIFKATEGVEDFKWLKLAVWSDRKKFEKWLATPLKDQATPENQKRIHIIIREVSYSLLRATRNRTCAYALMMAAVNKELDLPKLLLLVPDIYSNAKNEYRETTTSVLADSVEIEIIKLTFGDPRDYFNEHERYAPVLLDASMDGDWEIVKLLISAGANVNCTDNWNVTPLMLAIKHNQEKIVELLLISPGININHKDRDGWDARMWAARRSVGIQNLLNNFVLRPHATIQGILIKLLTENNKNTLSHVLENTSKTKFLTLSSPAATSIGNGKNNIQASSQLQKKPNTTTI